MSKASRRKRRLRKQRKQLNRQEQQSVPQFSDEVDMDESVWKGPDDSLGRYIRDETRRTLKGYREQPNWIERDANEEHDTARGGYAHRQLFELVQNSADTLKNSNCGRISLKLTDKCLYCADDGQAISQEGVRALMFSHMSPKRDTAEIGRFGKGFKAVLGVTDTPEFFSRSGSFRWNRANASKQIRSYVPDAKQCPVLPLPVPVNPWPEMDQDPDLYKFMSWAVNIVRLSLSPGAFEDLKDQFDNFPAEFLLFVNHVSMLSLQQVGEGERLIQVRSQREVHTLFDGTKESRWRVFDKVHKLSTEARNDSRSLDNAKEVPIIWAAPLEKLEQSGSFWAFFPTLTASPLAGILNAPWKTNEDRQNLLKGEYNTELIEAAAELASESITDLSSQDDPGRHLDALPRTRNDSDRDREHSFHLRGLINRALRNQSFVPDQRGELRKLDELNYQPEALTLGQPFALEALDIWKTFHQRPTHWLHHSALTRVRLARLAAIKPELVTRGWSTQTLRAEVSEWLEQLVQAARGQSNAIEASKLAIQAAAKAQEYQAANHKLPIKNLGRIVLTATGSWMEPNPEQLFLAGELESLSKDFLLHPEVERCPLTRAALKQLGIRPRSKGWGFKETVNSARAAFNSLGRALESELSDLRMRCKRLWIMSRSMAPEEAAEAISNEDCWRNDIPILVKSGGWCAFSDVLLPGDIVPADGSRDADVAVDTCFHYDDMELLKILGVVSEPVAKVSESVFEPPQWLYKYQNTCKNRYRNQVKGHPQRDYLVFHTDTCSGPLGPLQLLSDEGRVRYTRRLLDLKTTFQKWEMGHRSQKKYPEVPFPSPAVEMLLKFGMVQTTKGIVRLDNGVGETPSNPEVVDVLLRHPNRDQIVQAFDVRRDHKAGIEPVGEEEGVPIVDEWPLLQEHLKSDERELQLVRCKGFRRTYSMAQVNLPCIRMGNSLYVAQQADETEELAAVLSELGKSVTKSLLEYILSGSDPLEIQKAIEEVSRCKTNEERLLTAVGVDGLKRKLAPSLPSMLTEQLGSTLGMAIARAAIAKFHTGALKAYRDDLQHLNPPRRWAGSKRAIRFVQSLGFDEDWAGHRDTKRDAYVEVIGPRSLPCLHPYQRTAVRNVRNLVSSNGTGLHRGMLSMPTGSGKTRVAVQALVESMRDGELQGGILWVADRDELCEQAVEAWQAVWASEGEQAGTLRISRLWDGNKRPLPTSKRHVIVASIQTLHSRFSRQPKEYRFLSDFNLVVVDEAHRSIAPSYTSVFREMGLTRWFKDPEPTLIGLTATPYRGFNEEETKWLQSRYGNRRLDHGIFPTRDSNAVIRSLQLEGILAMADHATIDGGEVHLTDKELEDAKQTPWLPSSVEDRIARDAVRTRRIVNEYLHRVDPDWPTLIFATSVEHSEIVAALLNSEGITARAVSTETETPVRRRVVEEFRSGSVQVLVNYGVFREGFDAPKTRAIVVARPVYSPNLYFQMIGRGLRGVKNGGNERCLVLNVSDNIRNFGRDLAFSELDWLWDD